MSKHDNQNSNNTLSDQESDFKENSKYSKNSPSNVLNLYSKTSIIVSKDVENNDNVSSVIEDVLQKCDERIKHNARDTVRAGPSKECDKNVSILHPKQFDATSASDHIFSEPWLSREPLSTTPNIAQPFPRMSDAAFKCFILQSFPSAIDLRRKNSSAWHDLLHSKNALRKPTNDNSTQFDLPSIYEDATSVFSRNVITTSQEIQISPSLVPPRPIHGTPPLQGAPPSYSAVMRIGNMNNTPSGRTFGRRVGSHIEPSPPFISPSPPPTYAEAQGRYYRPILVDSELIWGPDPMATVCQRCGAHIITATTSQRSNLTHFAAVALCLCGCWPCCLLPYCMNSCKNTYHYCPNCNTYLGMYRPW